ncbi:hypothetical protein SQ11_06880 [Nitrosospira sp. NpAV]|nr:hypothetical protein SQ11_06880 [Nitrosospira sp. NpAV]
MHPKNHPHDIPTVEAKTNASATIPNDMRRPIHDPGTADADSHIQESEATAIKKREFQLPNNCIDILIC